MRTIHFTGSLDGGWTLAEAPAGFAPQLVLWVGARQADGAALQAALQRRFPSASVVGCSTGGEIVDGEVRDDSLIATAIEFADSTVKVVSAEDLSPAVSESIGERLALALHGNGLRGVMILSDGLKVSGTALGRGFTKVLGSEVPVCGALAGDGARFEQTWVACNAPPVSGRVVAVGFYGESLRLCFGTGGGWDRFGPERQITRSDNNCLFELDGQPALSLYKKYLGDEASGLPGSALHFPLFVRPVGGGGGVTRTVLGVSEQAQSLTFAGDLPTARHRAAPWHTPCAAPHQACGSDSCAPAPSRCAAGGPTRS